MAESVLYLSWKDHTSELTTIYRSLLENNFLADCTISAGGQSLKAHKLVLCACSSYFHKLFQEETGKHTFVVILDATFEMLKAMIEFMYRGETQISNGDLKAFLTLARALQIKGLNNNSKDKASRNTSSSTAGNVPGGPSEDNRNTSDVAGVNISHENSRGNISQPLPHRSADYQNAVQANSSLPFEGYSATRVEAWPSQEYQQPLGGDGVPATLDVVVKSESLYAVISETRNDAWHQVNSGEQVSGNFTSEVPQGTASALGERDLNQYSNCPESSLGNVESSEVLPPQQQHMQVEDEVSCDQDFIEQEECLPPAVFVPVNEESEEPMDIPRPNTNEREQSAGGRSNFLQPPSQVFIILDDSDDLPTRQPLGMQLHSRSRRKSLSPPLQSESQQHQDRPANKRQHSEGHSVVTDRPADKRQHSEEESVVTDRPADKRQSVIKTPLDDKRQHSTEKSVFTDRPADKLQSVVPDHPAGKSQHSDEDSVVTGRPADKCPQSDEELVVTDEDSEVPCNSTSPNRTLRKKNGESCDICGITVNKSYLPHHMKIHTGERRHICEFCNRAFLNRQDLKSHRRTHTGERPYKCDVCGNGFARSDTLRIHKRRHTGERPFRCVECGEQFTRRHLLANHMRAHPKFALSQ